MRTVGNLLTAVISLTLFLGGAEWGVRTFGSERVRTYFDEQTERALGKPVPPKEPGEYRIFIFGGSAAYGFPVADRYSITAWLRKSFPLLLPQKKIRAINCGWPGKGSYHAAEGARLVTKYKPDLFILYTGENDFPTTNRLYADNWLYRLNLHLTFRSSAYRLLQNRMNRVRKKIVYGKSGYPEKHYREEIIAQKVYKRAETTDVQEERILQHHYSNLEGIARWSKQRGIQLILLTMPSNVHEIPPAASSHKSSLSKEELEAWNRWFQAAQSFEGKKEYHEALEAYEKAAQMDPGYAELQYRIGVVGEAVGDYEAARKAYVLARDYDRRPSRAKTRMNENVREISEKYKGGLVDVVSVFERLSPHGIISGDLVQDDVHPTVRAQQIIVDEILHAIAEKGWIAPSSEWQWRALEAAREDPARNEEWKVEGNLNAYRYLLRGLHFWGQGRYGDCVRDLEKSLELMPKFIEAYAFLGDAYCHLQKSHEALQAFGTLRKKDAALSELLMKKYPEIGKSYLQTVRQ